MKDLTQLVANPEDLKIFNGLVKRITTDASLREFIRAGLDTGRKDPFAFHAYRIAEREIERQKKSMAHLHAEAHLKYGIDSFVSDMENFKFTLIPIEAAKSAPKGRTKAKGG